MTNDNLTIESTHKAKMLHPFLWLNNTCCVDKILEMNLEIIMISKKKDTKATYGKIPFI